MQYTAGVAAWLRSLCLGSSYRRCSVEGVHQILSEAKKSFITDDIVHGPQIGHVKASTKSMLSNRANAICACHSSFSETDFVKLRDEKTGYLL